MDDRIKAALNAPPDYSAGFTSRMEALRGRLQEFVGAPVYLDTDMNYAAAQKLSIFVDDEECPVPMDHDSRSKEIVYLVSSRADVYTIYELVRMTGNEWHVSTSSANSSLKSKLAGVLKDEGYEPVRGDVLTEMAPGCVTEMDGVPATVFQVLFSELY